ncbi:acyltransferase [Aetokthonos hydrillicola Thurmond2011]|jgi:peptidoglycan/LPS O-acetylase OafA/YrhL|uniref:Acyltransferase n=2 Tax=Aetokthonos TaxID=1550243 RepID=A0AAP5MC42_9CYAN|nr:acyltransferase [Aetokthonos hydrillicola]MBO3458407.1 acyltransferase [Aetokthonos hydrillicola CCALA 1050]MBW4586266.1 acyltransferase [Aetokthonos hydrillicola CCALA 1050]MDR9897873.1 acyltransferase [Aetokthonos hydrillicola Thurmond2011]
MTENFIQTTISDERKFRLHFLDGMRGIAAFYVLLTHLWIYQGENLPQWINIPTKLTRYGSFCVVVFIVLSGYCLMLPVARSQTGYIPGTLSDYFKRRARRIIPPLYAAILFCCLLSWGILVLERFTTFQWQMLNKDMFSPHFSITDVLLHVFLIQNFTTNAQTYMLNIPLWSVALEWQIYFFFPLLFLPIRHRYGWIVAIGTAFFLGIMPHYLLNGYMDVSHPWLMGSFTFGMLAAEITFSQVPFLVKLRNSLPWHQLSIVFAAIAILTEWNKLGIPAWIYESFAGIAAACLIVDCTKIILIDRKRHIILRILENPVVLNLEAFSYSLYLTHAPIITLLRQLLTQFNMSPTAFTITLYTVGIAISLAFAYVFYLTIERPFLLLLKIRKKLAAN